MFVALVCGVQMSVYKTVARGGSEGSGRLKTVVAYLLLLVRISHSNQHFSVLFGEGKRQ